MKPREYFPTLNEINIQEIKTRLELIAERAADAKKWFDKHHESERPFSLNDMYTMISAELFYLKDYADKAQQALDRMKRDRKPEFESRGKS